MPHRHAYLERLDGPQVVSKHPLAYEQERHFIGREHAAVLKLSHPATARMHVQLEFGPLGRWWFDELGSPHGVWVNQTHYLRARRILEPGDVLRVTGHVLGDLVLRYGVEGWAPKDAPLRALIDEAPQDTARWEVWADFLEEQADPLAQRIRGGGPSPGDVGVSSGHGWEHGFIARGVLKRGGRVLASLRKELKELLGNPFSRWMRALHVDFVSYQDGSIVEELELLGVLQILARERPAALRVLTFHTARPPLGPRLQAQFSTLKQALPQLQSDFDALVQR
jgi:hypothetical protein